MSLDTLWGSFEKSDVIPEEETEETSKEDTVDITEKETEEDEEKKDDVAEDKEEEKEEDKKEDEVEDEDSTEDSTIFDAVNSTLEEEELIFLPEDAQYDKSSEGLSKMFRDNMEGYKAKVDADLLKREAEIRAEYESAGTPKFKDMDVENPNQSETLLRQYYKETGFEDSEIDEKLKELKDLENMPKEAKIAQRFLAKKEEKEEAKAKDAAKQAELDKQQQIEDYIADLKSTINSTEEMAGFKLTNKMKKDFSSYLFDVDKSGKTQSQKNGTDPQRRLKLAFLDFVEFNKKDFEIKAKTEATNELKKKASRFKSSDAKTKGKTVSKEVNEDQGFNKGFLDFWSK